MTAQDGRDMYDALRPRRTVETEQPATNRPRPELREFMADRIDKQPKLTDEPQNPVTYRCPCGDPDCPPPGA